MKATLIGLLSRPFIRFAISGGLAAGINILSRITLSQITPYSIAVTIAYLFGMTTAFVLMKLMVFKKSGQHLQQEYVRFALVNVIAFAQVWVVSVSLARYLLPAMGFQAHSDTIGHVIGVLSPIATSYFMHKYFTFSKQNI
ncbi:GtrA family protein [Rhizobium sp. B230/85]|uniref:GtrA family protein n=1 Tax=unclassified Rhizobium TaxID=2613769 RepID=UPI001ADD050C|nr:MULTISPECIES: GtrA family protein [unclassified Rhizobium]MBO9136816.1 GtrA family protein [Rhizobium sp. B209b/85]QXZ99010.1 GtrA family protein [Rhizobium sp. B230/85]